MEDPLIEPPNYYEICGKQQNYFLKRIYFILFLQYAFSLGMCLIFKFNNNVVEFIEGEKGESILIGSYVVQFVFMIILVFTKIYSINPWNYIILILFTICISITLASITGYYQTNSVIVCVICAMINTLGLSIYAFQTIFNFRGYGPYLLCCSLTIFFFGLIYYVYTIDIFTLIYGSLAIILFSIYLVFDTQLMILGNLFMVKILK